VSSDKVDVRYVAKLARIALTEEEVERFGSQLADLLQGAGFDVRRASYWGFPVMLAYDTLFLLPMNKRRARRASLPGIARAGRATWLVSLVRAVFSIDRLFGFIPFGPGLLLVGRRNVGE